MRRGSKYDPLRDFLITSRQAELELSMSEVEEILGFALCRSADTPQFWANVKGRTRHTQYRSWRDAGYDAFPKPDRDSVRFVRIAPDRRAATS